MSTIIAFSGSNSRDSINRKLLQAVSAHIEGHTIEEVDIRDYDMPIYSIDDENSCGHPDTAKTLYEKFKTADAFILASPENNGLMPAVLKNAIDWLSRIATKDEPIFGHKPVLLISTSPGANGGATNIKIMAELLPWWGGKVSGTYSLGSFHDTFANGNITSDEELTKLQKALTAFLGDIKA